MKRSTHGRAVLGLTAVASALAGMTLVAGSAVAGTQHPSVVSEDPADVAQLVSTESGSGIVNALAEDSTSGTIFLGGDFEQLRDATGTHVRSSMAAVDSVRGQVLPFNVRLNGPALALLRTGDALYIGGSFTQVNGKPFPHLVKVDPATGAIDPAFRFSGGGAVSDLAVARGRLVAAGSFNGFLRSLNRDSGQFTRYLTPKIEGKVARRADATTVGRIAVNPAGNRLVAVGNFARINGETRKRVFMLNLRARRTVLSSWYYAPLMTRCNTNVPEKIANISDVDFAPDGSYFVLGSTGGPVREGHPEDIGTVICDAAARFDTTVLAPTKPVWINYTGGDTIWSVLSTGAAVYVQGHFRCLDNPQGRPDANNRVSCDLPGAVDRRGIGALNPATGKALEWNPGMPTRRGGRALLSTAEGLWVGSDMAQINGEPHRGLGFFPLDAPPA